MPAESDLIAAGLIVGSLVTAIGMAIAELLRMAA